MDSGCILGKKFFCKRVVGHWHRLCREVVEPLSLEVFRNCGDVALRAVLHGHGGAMLGLAIPEVFSNLNGSMIQLVFPGP